MSDILEMLRKTANKEFGTYDVADDSVRIGCGSLREAADEIEKLRGDIQFLKSVAGLAIDGSPFSEIKKEIRHVK